MAKSYQIEGEEIFVSESKDPSDLPLWYEQFLKLEPSERKAVAKTAFRRVQEKKPETAAFIKNFDCELVGISPRVEYGLLTGNKGELGATWLHAFSMPTLLYWCAKGGFTFMVNVNLKYNDTILNDIEGNSKDRGIRGFTG